MRHATFAALMLAVAGLAATPATQPAKRYTLKPNAPDDVVKWWNNQAVYRQQRLDDDREGIRKNELFIAFIKSQRLSAADEKDKVATMNAETDPLRDDLALVLASTIHYPLNGLKKSAPITWARQLTVVSVIDDVTMIVSNDVHQTYVLKGFKSVGLADADVIHIDSPLWELDTMKLKGKTYHVRVPFDVMTYLQAAQ